MGGEIHIIELALFRRWTDFWSMWLSSSVSCCIIDTTSSTSGFMEHVIYNFFLVDFSELDIHFLIIHRATVVVLMQWLGIPLVRY